MNEQTTTSTVGERQETQQAERPEKPCASPRDAPSDDVRQGQPAGRPSWGLGAATGICLVLVALSGLFMSLYFQPNPSEALKSVEFITAEAPFGEFARNLHRWGALFLVVLLAAHFISGLARGNYCAPRRTIWVLGSLMAPVLCIMIVTGFMVTWHFRSYWIIQTVTNWFDKLPLLTGFFQWLFYEGAPGDLVPVGRWFALHAIILPAIMAILLFFHVSLFQQRGTKAAPKTRRRNLAIVGSITLGIILTAKFGTMEIDAADPVTTTNIPQPSWLLLFFCQVTRYCQDNLEMLGAFWLPMGLLAACLLMVCFKRGETSRFARYGLLSVFLTIFLTLGVVTQHTYSTTPLESCEACHKEGFGDAFAIPPTRLSEISTHYDNKWLALHYRFPQYYWMMGAEVPMW